MIAVPTESGKNSIWVRVYRGIRMSVVMFMIPQLSSRNSMRIISISGAPLQLGIDLDLHRLGEGARLGIGLKLVDAVPLNGPASQGPRPC